MWGWSLPLQILAIGITPGPIVGNYAWTDRSVIHNKQYKMPILKTGVRTVLGAAVVFSVVPPLSRLSNASAATAAAPPQPPSISPQSSETERWTTDGYYTRKNFLNSSQMQRLLITFSSEITEKVVAGKEISVGRFHYDMLPSGTFISSKEVKDLISTLIEPIASDLMEMNHADGQLMMTTLQIVDSLPGSALQIWHADNAEKGITVVIPLVDLTEQNGPTELIAGSHSLFENIRSNVSHVTPLLSAGDALIFDARTLHRGGANQSDTSRAILVVRFDNKKTQPPCMSVVGATARLFLAKSIIVFLESYDYFKR